MKIKKKYFIIILILICFFYNQGYFVFQKDDSYLKTMNIHKSPYSGVITYLINLERSPQRLNYMMPKIEKLDFPFQRISAVDGKALSQSDIQKKFNLKKYYTMQKLEPIGGFGCTLSHINTWKTFLESNYEYALILEDDADFDPEVLSQTVHELIKNKELWDVNTFDPIRRNIRTLTIKKLDNNHDLVLYLTNILSTTGYLLSRKAAEEFLMKAFPIIIPVDRYFTRAWEFDLKFTGISPKIASQKYGHSEILSTDPLLYKNAGISKLQIVTGFFTHEIFRLQSYIIRYFYNLKLYYNLKK